MFRRKGNADTGSNADLMTVDIERLLDEPDDSAAPAQWRPSLWFFSFSRMMANSSPPSRATTSVSRSDDFSRSSNFDEELIAGGMP